jgi:hypothetical protein
MAPSSPPFQLKLDNWPEWVLIMIVVFSSYGSEGRLMIQCLRGQPYQRPEAIEMDSYLQTKWSSVLVAHDIKHSKDRRDTLYAPPTYTASKGSDSEGEADSQIHPEVVPTIFSQLPLRTRSSLAEKFDQYKSDIIEGLTKIYSVTLLQFISPEIMSALEAHPRYLELIEAQDAILLYEILEEICLRLGGDKLGKIEEDIENHVQTVGMLFTEFKSLLDRLFEKFRLYNGGEKMSERAKVRRLLNAVNPLLYDVALQKYHKEGGSPLYADVCLNLQAIEDAENWAISNRARHIQRQLGSADSNSPRLLAAVVERQKNFCGICFQRTLKQQGTGMRFPHSEAVCLHRDWESRT